MPISLYIVEHLVVQLVVWKRAGVLAPRWRPRFIIYYDLHNLDPSLLARADCLAYAIQRLCPRCCLDDDIRQEQCSRDITVGSFLCQLNIE